MSLVTRLQAAAPPADRLQPEVLLAIAAGGAIIPVALASVSGAASALPAVVGLVILIVLFAFAATVRPRNRARAAVISAAGLLVTIPVASWLYPNTYGLSLLAPLAFVLAIPHVRGWPVVVLAVASTASAIAGIGLRLSSTGRAMDPIGDFATWYGIAATTAILMTLTWRMHRRAVSVASRFDRVVGDLPMGVARCAPDGRVIDANAAFARILGYGGVDDLVARDPRRLDGPCVPTAVLGVGPGEHGQPDTHEGEVALDRADGGTVWVWFRSRSIRDGAGAIAWYDLVLHDVTADRADRESRDLLAAIVETAPDAVFAQSLDGTVITWNAGGEAIYGWLREELVGRDVRVLIPDEERPAHDHVLARVTAGEVVGPLDVRRITKDGREIIVSLIVAPARDANGSVVAAATIARDVTEQHRLRAEQASLEAQLRQAQKLEAVGRLAGGVAHDFNNLLTAIKGYGQLVADGLTGSQLEDQQVVLGAATRASELVRRLLDLSRHAPLDPRTLDVDAVLAETLTMVRRLVPATVELEASLRAGAVVTADRVELEQAVLNLVANAVEAMPAGGRIEVRSGVVMVTPRQAGAALQPGEHVQVVVQDTGIGMDEVTRARVFEPFFTTKGPAEHSGLGLSSVYGFAQRARGRVDVRSSLGTGTTVTLLLPLVPAGAEPGEDVPRRYVPIGTERILLVEDDPAVRDLAARVLRRARYEVVDAASPADALAVIADPETPPFDALVSDVIMPGMTGADLAARQQPDLPIVFMSGYPGDAMPALELERPTRRFITKPFEPVALVAALREVLDAAGSLVKG